jgi:hypothetical protein
VLCVHEQHGVMMVMTMMMVIMMVMVRLSICHVAVQAG